MNCSKGQLIAKANWQVMNSSKNRMYEFVFTTMQCVLICFLEEIEDTKMTLPNYRTFSDLKIFENSRPSASNFKSFLGHRIFFF